MSEAKFELRVWKLVGVRVYDELHPALRDLDNLTLFHGKDALGRVTEMATGGVINEFHKPDTGNLAPRT